MKNVMLKVISEAFLYSILFFTCGVIIIKAGSEMLINNYQNYLDNQTSITRIEYYKDDELVVYELKTKTIQEFYLDKLPFIEISNYE